MHKKISGLLAGGMLLAGVGGVSAFTPLGFPYNGWGEASYGRIEGAKIDMYVEQGIDWVKLGSTPVVVNTFVGVRGTMSERPEDYWNNKIGTVAGVKLKMALPTTPGHWNQLSVGVRVEQVNYLTTDRSTLQGLVFFQFGAGGDWKKK